MSTKKVVGHIIDVGLFVLEVNVEGKNINFYDINSEQDIIHLEVSRKVEIEFYEHLLPNGNISRRIVNVTYLND